MTRIQDKPPANLRISKTERSLKSEKGPKRRAEKASEEPHYPKDTHNDFCRRCRAFYRRCPITKNGAPSRECSL